MAAAVMSVAMAGPSGRTAAPARESTCQPSAAGPRTLTDPVPFSAWRIDPRRPSAPTAYA